MSKQLKFLSAIVMGAALAVIVCCAANYIGLNKELRSCKQQLSESIDKWEKIAAEKEELQVGLKVKQKELKIAQVSLDEAKEDAESIRNEIEQLRLDIESLKQQKPAAQ